MARGTTPSAHRWLPMVRNTLISSMSVSRRAWWLRLLCGIGILAGAGCAGGKVRDASTPMWTVRPLRVRDGPVRVVLHSTEESLIAYLRDLPGVEFHTEGKDASLTVEASFDFDHHYHAAWWRTAGLNLVLLPLGYVRPVRRYVAECEADLIVRDLGGRKLNHLFLHTVGQKCLPSFAKLPVSPEFGAARQLAFEEAVGEMRGYLEALLSSRHTGGDS